MYVYLCRYDKLADELKAVTLATVRTYYEKWVPDMRKTPLFGAIYIYRLMPKRHHFTKTGSGQT
eukprot:COSAG06_NODE_22_length_33148_cov_102.016279_25_plen_64_part_00